MQTPLLTNDFSMSGKPAQAAYTELHDLANIRRQAKHDQMDAMREVAKQFESLFLKMMLKSMRQASFGNPLFDDSKTELYRDMADNQIALDLANGKGIGLADSLMKQLSQYANNSEQQIKSGSFKDKQHTTTVTPLSLTKEPGSKLPENIDVLPLVDLRRAIPAGNSEIFRNESQASSMQGKTMPVSFEDPESFVRQMWPMAQHAAKELGVSPRVLIAQAALETGWGKAVSQFDNGTSSHNLFNIKADHRWTGNTINKSTVEFTAGTAKRQVASFRAYDNYAESFRDYVQFLKSNPRYQNVLASSHDADKYINELQHAGYATDPEYANKILDILQRNSMQIPDVNHTVLLDG